jgi:hypothetical protein
VEAVTRSDERKGMAIAISLLLVLSILRVVWLMSARGRAGQLFPPDRYRTVLLTIFPFTLVISI